MTVPKEQDELSGFVARAVDYGGVVFEDDKPTSLAEAMAALEKGLAHLVCGTRNRRPLT